MGLSETELEARLAALRHRREALDREIADLVLYLELGRRLGAAGTPPADRDRDGPAGAIRGAGSPPGPAAGPDPAPRPERGPDTASSAPTARGAPDLAAGAPAARDPAPSGAAAIPPPIPFTEDAAGARRYGRAVVEAACGVIAAAGRPLHAAAILDILLERGFTLPGRDPVAALNTRLWKRSGPGGPLRRVGEATYALAAGSDPGPA